MTHSLTSKLAREFELDFLHLSLVQWRQDDTDSITECFDGCYGAFIDTGMFHVPEASMLELTRGEIALGKRCLEAAKVELSFTFLFTFHTCLVITANVISSFISFQLNLRDPNTE